MLTGRLSWSQSRPNTACNVDRNYRQDLPGTARPRTAGIVDRVNSRYSIRRRYHLNCTERSNYGDCISRTPSKQDIERQKYSFKPAIRPQSAPLKTLCERKRLEILSSKLNGGRGHIKCSLSRE
jgi:hypothetical protein